MLLLSPYNCIIGVDVPVVGEKRARPGTRVRPSKQKELQKSSSTEEPSASADQQAAEQAIEDSAQAPEAEKEEEVKESWDAESSDEEQETEASTEPPVSVETADLAKPSAPKPGAEPEPESEDDESSQATSDDSDESLSDDDQVDKRSEALTQREKALERIAVSRNYGRLLLQSATYLYVIRNAAN